MISNQKPDNDFFQSFAEVVGNHWPSLAPLLSLTAGDIEEIKKQSSQQVYQAQVMLKKWRSGEEATYGQLCERLMTLSPFHC